MTSVQSRTNQRLEHSSVFCTEAKDGEEKLKSTKVNARSTSVETGKTKKIKKNTGHEKADTS